MKPGAQLVFCNNTAQGNTVRNRKKWKKLVDITMYLSFIWMLLLRYSHLSLSLSLMITNISFLVITTLERLRTKEYRNTRYKTPCLCLINNGLWSKSPLYRPCIAHLPKNHPSWGWCIKKQKNAPVTHIYNFIFLGSSLVVYRFFYPIQSRQCSLLEVCFQGDISKSVFISVPELHHRSKG